MSTLTQNADLLTRLRDWKDHIEDESPGELSDGVNSVDSRAAFRVILEVLGCNESQREELLIDLARGGRKLQKGQAREVNFEAEEYLAARWLAEDLGIEWRFPVPEVGSEPAGMNAVVIRSSAVESHPDDPDFAVVTRYIKGREQGQNYVTHVLNRSLGGYFYGDYTSDPIEAMQNHNERIKREHREDLHGTHEELGRSPVPGGEQHTAIVLRDLHPAEYTATFVPKPEMAAIFREGGNALILGPEGDAYEGPVGTDGTIDVSEFARLSEEKIDPAAQAAIDALKDQR